MSSGGVLGTRQYMKIPSSRIGALVILMDLVMSAIDCDVGSTGPRFDYWTSDGQTLTYKTGRDIADGVVREALVS